MLALHVDDCVVPHGYTSGARTVWHGPRAIRKLSASIQPHGQEICPSCLLFACEVVELEGQQRPIVDLHLIEGPVERVTPVSLTSTEDQGGGRVGAERERALAGHLGVDVELGGGAVEGGRDVGPFTNQQARPTNSLQTGFSGCRASAKDALTHMTGC
jgi:hypothetical protein